MPSHAQSPSTASLFVDHYAEAPEPEVEILSRKTEPSNAELEITYASALRMPFKYCYPSNSLLELHYSRILPCCPSPASLPCCPSLLDLTLPTCTALPCCPFLLLFPAALPELCYPSGSTLPFCTCACPSLLIFLAILPSLGLLPATLYMAFWIPTPLSFCPSLLPFPATFPC